MANNKVYNFVGQLKKCLLISGALFLVGIIIAVSFGVNMDINFVGGSRYTYTYSGELNTSDVNNALEAALGFDVNTTLTTSYGDNTGSSKIVVSISSGNQAEDTQKKIEKALSENFPDAKATFADSNSVMPTIANSFFTKSILAVILAGILVIVYTSIRFRKIGGFSAGCMALVALIHDILVAFFICVIFRLPVDASFMAVILTILGYSLNDTIVIYDRIRENTLLNPRMPLRERVNLSISQTFVRTITTSVTTLIAIVVIIIVSELFGLTTLRSFAIPMAFGIISGSYSTIMISSSLWVVWREFADKKRKKKHPYRAK